MTDLNSSADHSTLLQEDHESLRAALAGFTKTTIFAINRLYHGTLDGQNSSGGITAAIQAGPSEAVYLIYLSVDAPLLQLPLSVAKCWCTASSSLWKSLFAKNSSSSKPCPRYVASRSSDRPAHSLIACSRQPKFLTNDLQEMAVTVVLAREERVEAFWVEARNT